MNSFETLETVDYRVDWLRRGRETDEKLEETVWHVGFHSVVNADLSVEV